MSDETLAEMRAYWRLSDELIARATKDDLAEAARILALQAAHYARRYGELPLPVLDDLLAKPRLEPEDVAMLRDGTEALVGVLAGLLGGLDEPPPQTVQ